MLFTEVGKTPGGIYLGAPVIWNGVGWQAMESPPSAPVVQLTREQTEKLLALPVPASQITAAEIVAMKKQLDAVYNPEPKQVGTLCGLPVFVRLDGYRNKSFHELFYGEPSVN